MSWETQPNTWSEPSIVPSIDHHTDRVFFLIGETWVTKGHELLKLCYVALFYDNNAGHVLDEYYVISSSKYNFIKKLT